MGYMVILKWKTQEFSISDSKFEINNLLDYFNYFNDYILITLIIMFNLILNQKYLNLVDFYVHEKKFQKFLKN